MWNFLNDPFWQFCDKFSKPVWSVSFPDSMTESHIVTDRVMPPCLDLEDLVVEEPSHTNTELLSI